MAKLLGYRVGGLDDQCAKPRDIRVLDAGSWTEHAEASGDFTIVVEGRCRERDRTDKNFAVADRIAPAANDLQRLGELGTPRLVGDLIEDGVASLFVEI